MTMIDLHNASQPRNIMIVEQELLNSTKAKTKLKLFYSIKSLKFRETEGCCLLVTHKNLVANAKKFIDWVFEYFTMNSPNNMASISYPQAQVTCANHVKTSDCFESCYTSMLLTMILDMICTHVPVQNAWKCRPHMAMNLTAELPCVGFQKETSS